MSDCCSMQGSASLNGDDRLKMSSAVPWPNFPMESRIRVLRMVRQFPICRSNMFSTSSNSSFGFTVRGGKEHGTGFFVSQVGKNSEADFKGLQLGDQILWVNQFRIDNATHKEFVQMISSQDCITLKVRNTGFLPIRDKKRDFLYWSEITDREETSEANNNIACVDAKSQNAITVFLHVEPGSKLGLGICKGPSWKPGIFVLFTKENSLAHRAGLRPGDQIISVNGISFANVLFSEAVTVMKSSNKLKMLVRTSSASDFGGGPTSDYNSSSNDGSMICDDGGSKRNIHANNVESYKDFCSPRDDMKKEFNKTIIELVDNSKQDQFNGNNNNNNDSTINCTVNSSSDRDFKPSVIVTKHEKLIESKVPEAPAFNPLKIETNNKENKNAGNKAGVGYNSSLTSAIAEEIKKRKEKMEKNSTETTKIDNLNKSATKVTAQNTQTAVKNQQVENFRSALVDEFKRVHHRMVLKIKDDGQME